jgi:putative ABC transport system permease protein
VVNEFFDILNIMSVSGWIFALSGIMAMGIAFVSVSWQSYRSARKNPVDVLRYE